MHKLCLINKRSVLCIINYKTLTLWILIWTDRSYWHSGISSLAWEFLFSANMAVFICILTYCKNRKRNLDKKKISKGRFQKNMYEGVGRHFFFVKTHHLYNLKKKKLSCIILSIIVMTLSPIYYLCEVSSLIFWHMIWMLSIEHHQALVISLIYDIIMKCINDVMVSMQ